MVMNSPTKVTYTNSVSQLSIDMMHLQVTGQIGIGHIGHIHTPSTHLYCTCTTLLQHLTLILTYITSMLRRGGDTNYDYILHNKLIDHSIGKFITIFLL